MKKHLLYYISLFSLLALSFFLTSLSKNLIAFIISLVLIVSATILVSYLVSSTIKELDDINHYKPEPIDIFIITRDIEGKANEGDTAYLVNLLDFMNPQHYLGEEHEYYDFLWILTKNGTLLATFNNWEDYLNNCPDWLERVCF